MRRLASASPLIRMTVVGEPPHRYRVTFLCKGIFQDAATGRLKTTSRHVADIYLHVDYPRLAPNVVWRTPIFHPNFRFEAGAGTVCVPNWTPAWSLAGFVVLLGRMVQYQEYDRRYPLNWEAAVWAAEHERLLPVDKRPLAPPGLSFDFSPSAEASR